MSIGNQGAGSRYARQKSPTGYYHIMMVFELSGLQDSLEVSHIGKDERDILLHELKKNGASVRQLSRITGVNRNIIQRA